MAMNVPLSKPYRSNEHLQAIEKVLEDGRFVNGPETEGFEKEFARFVGSKHAVAVSSGTAALHLALLSVGIEENAEVITVSHTFIATIESIWHINARPKLADIDEHYYVMDTSNVPALLSAKTRAIIPVHIFGHPVDMDPLCEMAAEEDLALIEDAAQAHGSQYKGRVVGAIGDVGCFSFYPSKNLTVCGDGGMLVTNDSEIARKARMLRDHGRDTKYASKLIGYNYRLGEIGSAIGRVSLKHLNEWNDDRRRIALKYSEALADEPKVALPLEADWARHVYHVFAIRCRDRDNLASWLAQNGVQTGIHYPVPCHLQPVYLNHEPATDLPETEKLAQQLLSLPMFPGMTSNQVDYVAEKIKSYYERAR